MIYYLANIGKSFGYNIWVGQREQGEKYGDGRLRIKSEDTRRNKETRKTEELARRCKRRSGEEIL